MDFINSYLKLLEEKDKLILAQCDRLGGGIQKIAEASVQLEDLNKKLAVQKVAVEEKTKHCEGMLSGIADRTGQVRLSFILSNHISCNFKATEKKQLAQSKGKEIEEQSKIISVEKKDAEDALSEALPALEAARLALDDLDKSDVTEIR